MFIKWKKKSVPAFKLSAKTTCTSINRDCQGSFGKPSRSCGREDLLTLLMNWFFRDDFRDGWQFIIFILTSEHVSLLVDSLSPRILVVRHFLFHEDFWDGWQLTFHESLRDYLIWNKYGYIFSLANKDYYFNIHKEKSIDK